MRMAVLKADGKHWVRCGISFAVGSLVTLGAVALHSSRHSPELAARARAPVAIAGHEHWIRLAHDGPWGDLECLRIPLQDAEDMFWDRAERVKPPRWIFENTSRAQLAELLMSCDLTSSQKAYLLDTNHWEPLQTGYAISPPDELVLGLSTNARARLYPLLGNDPANYPQSAPFRVPLDAFDERFADSGLPSEKIEFLRGLTYPDRGQLCLCLDRPLISSLPPNEGQCLIRNLYSLPAWRVRLRVGPDSDIDALLKYWARGRGARSLKPLLESLAARPGGGTIGVGYFLPPFARLRLDTYPDPVSDPAEAAQDCYYTALNFFREKPDSAYLDGPTASEVLRDDYEVVHPPAAFGDLIMLLDSAGKGIHVCVYVADDIVFTKNGYGPRQPWVLMRIPDMMTFYPSEKPLRMAVLRHRDS